ncbi:MULTISPECIES: hypothetical protein [Metallosphaera]|uniref:Uncharacterized protein n=3 Tax=Metallosphaera TaxID=41980 RepID=A4YG04_METS5|nr:MULTISPECIES: hypothetical protein [Metallosphaera]ABP95356.1 hypothetical protein Msed_1195 [Metallosphaera sedula DSM 5348]AIM27342.1 hypothetical protein HA72_1195 [Metallosphaera sedula]AKV74222.1 hypothetical protein MsedA_1213 [Metallosphaera sedula]AKV76461.1 hypothetical protein MsedB_1215 [Metallosphaera sedula]AKV78713.1 hypothetical protein MsedC_1213 [Metallosphaera sedula]
MRKGLSEVVAAFLSLVVTLSLMGIFLAYNSQYILPSSNIVQTPSVHLLSVLWTYNNGGTGCVYVENYGSTPITIAYAVVGNNPTPLPVTICYYPSNGTTPAPYNSNTLLPGYIYILKVTGLGGGNTQVTFFETDGSFFEVSL